MIGFVLGSCSKMDHTNVYDPAADYYEPPPVPTPTISPTGDKIVYTCGAPNSIQFTAEGGTPPYTWTIVEKDAACAPPYAYEYATINSSGLFKFTSPCVGCNPAYCKVKVTDSNGENVTSGKITINY